MATNLFTRKATTEAPKKDRNGVRNSMVMAGAGALTPFWQAVEAEHDRLEVAGQPKVEKRLTRD